MSIPNFTMKNYGVDAEDIESYEDAKVNALKANPSAKTFSVRAVALRLRQDHHVVIKGRPMRIVDLSFSKCACHRGGKIHIVAVDIFTYKKWEDITPVKGFIDAPIIAEAEYTVLNIDGPILNLLTDDGEPKDDVNVPHGKLGASLLADFAEGKDLRVKTLSALDEEQVGPFRLNAGVKFC
ncbi:Eukaryotic translation initiation factor 5A [Mycena venus]|uniref:Eukaryotic translation initiation factor 5A n=1 Tax=Mycena venus TaxID=2733690 RepID=A0A8H6WQ98_9AGAR|nr:Eukaryotic translation initiation factor 5A [Mycena venus]